MTRIGDGLFGWIHSKKTVYHCKKSLGPASKKFVSELVPKITHNQNVVQYWGGSDISVGDTNSGLVGRDNGAAASRESQIRLLDNMTR